MSKNLCAFLLLLINLTPVNVLANPAVEGNGQGTETKPAKTSSGLPIPRFVSLGSKQVFVRTGPALRYPIKWVYKHEGLPVEIVQEFDTWRKVRDIDGDTGWIHQSLLSGARSVTVKSDKGLTLRREPKEDSRIVAVLEPNVTAKSLSCQGAWCHLETGGYEGFAERKFLWGIYDAEDFD